IRRRRTALGARAWWDETEHAAVVEAEMRAFNIGVALADDAVVGDDHPLAVVRLGPPAAGADFGGRRVAVARGLAVLGFPTVAAGHAAARLLPLGIVVGVMKVMAVVLCPGPGRRGKDQDEHRQDRGHADVGG